MFSGENVHPLFLSEPDKHNQNSVEGTIQNLKSRCSKIRNTCGTGILAYNCETMEYFFDVNNYVARASLNNWLLYEVFWGETPEISTIRFKFWEPVYFRDWTNKSGKVLMHPRRFVGFNWNIGDPMTFNVITYNTDTHKRNMVVHRGVIVPRNLEAIG